MRKNLTKATAGLLSSAMILGLTVSAAPVTTYAATEHWNDASTESTAWTAWKEAWKTVSNDYEQVSLTPGEDETQLNFAWYCQTAETPAVRISTSEDMSNATEFSGTQTDVEALTDSSMAGYYSNKVTVTGLTENTQYYYQVYQNGAWQEAVEYSTKSFSEFSFLYVGDPQIGASKSQTSTEGDTMNSSSNNVANETDESANLAARNDAYNWNETLNEALSAHSEVSFMVSAGDQVNYSQNETEYAGYLSAEALDSLPVATTIGNHDSTSIQYSLHFNNPNTFDDDETGDYTTGKTAAGTDYYYTYGSVLFIVLDTNNYNCSTHENVIAKAVKENPDATWRVVVFHQDIYGSGYDHSDSDGMVLRTQLTPLMDEYDIDVVLQGHDHTYSRTYQLSSDGQEHSTYTSGSSSDESYQNDNLCYTIESDTVGGTVVNPEGTVYLEANSATGSKFYNLIASQQDYISERSQTWTPTYAVIDVTDTTFTMTTYDVETGRVLEGATSYTIVKEEEAGEQTITGIQTYTKTTDDAAFTLDAQTTGDGKLTYESSDEDVAVVSKSGKVTITGEGTATITVTAAATDSYKEASMTVTVTVTKAETPALKTQTITGTTSYSKTVGDAAFTLDAKTDGDGKLTYESSNEDVLTVSSKGKVTILGSGTATITVTAAETATYSQATMKITVTVAKAATTVKTQKITATTSYKKAYGASSFTLDAETNGDGKLTYKSSDTSVATVSSKGKVTIKGTGKTTITVTAAATASYSKATKKITLKVVPKKQTVSVKSTKTKQIKVTWTKDTKASGYEIVYATNKSFTKNITKVIIKTNKTTSKTIKNLKKGQKYYVKVRAYTTINGKRAYGSYSTIKSITCK
ncbi:MAG: metallophosphoesterase [Lachnospiraceae bacterium]|nr:metallophosphoesterase [Lachnospiraceae bacterium]